MSETTLEPRPETERAPRRKLPTLESMDRYLGTVSLVGGLLVWEALAWLLDVAWLPPFSAVVRKLIELTADGLIIENLMNSLKGLVIGFGIALVLALPIGALMGRYRRVHQALDPYVYALFIAPTMIFIPIFFAIFGLTDGTRIAIIVVYAIFVMIINTDAAIRNVDPSLIEMARSYGAKERHIFFRILVPAASPLALAGVQLGLGRGVKGMINGEMFIALVGLGALSQKFSGRFEADGAMAVAMVVLLVAIVANRLVKQLENRLTSWTDESL